MHLSNSVRHLWLMLGMTLLVGGAAGALGGWWVSSGIMRVSGDGRVTESGTAVDGTASASSTMPNVAIPPFGLERRLSDLSLPSVLSDHRMLSVASVYRASTYKAGDDALLVEDRLLGQAVAVTSDGWFVIPESAVRNVPVSEVVVWRNGVSATATRALVDRLSQVVFLKLANGMTATAPAFARTSDVTVGVPVWLERRALGYEPATVLALGEPFASLDGVSSESVQRRGVVSGATHRGDVGAPIWSANGELVGLVASVAHEPIRFIPASAFSNTLALLLRERGESAAHAYLGVRGVDLAYTRFEHALRALPERGVLIREDRRGKKPAVEPRSPAASAGLRAGDVIQMLDRDILDGSVDLAELLAEYHPNVTVTLTVWRNGGTERIPVTLGSVVTTEHRL
jgi:serine protease Do